LRNGLRERGRKKKKGEKKRNIFFLNGAPPGQKKNRERSSGGEEEGKGKHMHRCLFLLLLRGVRSGGRGKVRNVAEDKKKKKEGEGKAVAYAFLTRNSSRREEGEGSSKKGLIKLGGKKKGKRHLGVLSEDRHSVLHGKEIEGGRPRGKSGEKKGEADRTPPPSSFICEIGVSREKENVPRKGGRSPPLPVIVLTMEKKNRIERKKRKKIKDTLLFLLCCSGRGQEPPAF